ncbi:hypothetical protein LCGC14_1287950 [marine sediment metagenome]|uniref:Uncharacterized protein n=1 Tax=marine sediment metagenome TaxID=412755 RepID=A0A0F9KUY2_9ZZZZ
MKYRNGFVSNSSTTSFTIYGWSEYILGNICVERSDLFKGVTMNFEWDHLQFNIEEEYEGEEWDIVIGNSNLIQGDVIGVGYSEEEVDHEREPLKDGRYFGEPSEEKKKALDKVAEKFNLPKPQMYSKTWYNG